LKKVLSIIVILMLIFSTFSIFAPKLKAEVSPFQVLWRAPIKDEYWEDIGWGVHPGDLSVDAGDVDGDGVDDVAIIPCDWHRLSAGTVNTLQVFKSDGSELWSAPILIEGGRVAIADVDLDGKGEMFVFGTSTDIYGQPDTLIYAFDDDGTKMWEYVDNDDPGYRMARWITFTNIDADPELELIVANSGWTDEFTYALDTNGSLMWRFTGNEVDQMLLGDITGDGVEEVIILTNVDHMVYVLNKANGNLIWSFSTINYNRGVIGDITGDGINDLIVASGGAELYSGNKLYGIKSDGSLLWAKDYDEGASNRPTVPVLEDIDSDGINDIIVGAEQKIIAYKNDGAVLWSYGNSTFFNNQSPQLYRFDINRDGREEIVFLVGKDVYQISKDGTVTLVGTLPLADVWDIKAFQGKVTERESTETAWLVSGDINNDGFDELLFHEIIDGKFYVTVVMASSGQAYSGYLSDLTATYDDATQIMEYSWKVHVNNGLGLWKTKYYLYYTISYYTRNVTSVPVSWTESTRETISPGKSYQWKVELYDPNGSLVDTKWGEALSTRALAAIEAPPKVPFNRFFNINVTVYNPKEKGVSLNVALEERTGFQAGANYGDGDEVKLVSLAPNEEKTITFKAKVYGVLRTVDAARFRLYDEEGKQVDYGSSRINLKPDFAEVTAVLAPVAVRKGVSFTVGLPVFYSFSYNTSVEFVLTSKETGKTLQIQDLLNGEGLKFYSFRVDESLVDLDSEGVRNFEVKINVYYPEENYKMAYEKKFDIAVRISNDVGTASVIPDWSFRVALTYDGKQYVAVYAYNATDTPPPQTGDFKDIIEWSSTQRNWLVFEVDGANAKPVMNDELYKTLAFASEIAYLRATMWNSEYLASRSKWFDELSNLAKQAESCDFIAKLAGKLAGIIGLNAANAWASSVLSGVESGSKISDSALTIARAVKILEKLDLHGKVLSALNTGAEGEEILVWTAIFMMDGGKVNLDEANKLLEEISASSTIMNVDVDEALRFYNLVQAGESQGLGGMRFLSTHYSKDTIDVMGFKVNIRAFKDAFLEAIPLGDAYEFYEKLKEGLGVPDAFKFGQYISTVWDEYEIRKNALQSSSLKFRDKYISESMNSIAITLSETKTQQKLHLSVYDNEGRLAGFNKTSGIIEVNIPGCYYLDFVNVIKITLPRETKIDKILVDATEAELPVENYNLTVEVIKGGNPIGSTSKSGQIEKGALKEYSLQFTEDSKPIIEEVHAPNYLYYFAISIATLVAITVIVIALRRRGGTRLK